MQKISQVYSKAVGGTGLDTHTSDWFPLAPANSVNSLEVLKLHCDFKEKLSKVIYLFMLPSFSPSLSPGATETGTVIPQAFIYLIPEVFAPQNCYSLAVYQTSNPQMNGHFKISDQLSLQAFTSAYLQFLLIM